MARPDLTNEEIERMGREKPGSAAEYLRLRREELEAEKQAQRERDDEARFAEEFVAEGGEPEDAKVIWKEVKREQAANAAAVPYRADKSASQYTRDSIRRAL
jgi:hypothetical protein